MEIIDEEQTWALTIPIFLHEAFCLYNRVEMVDVLRDLVVCRKYARHIAEGRAAGVY
jgi:hypothetical protein